MQCGDSDREHEISCICAAGCTYRMSDFLRRGVRRASPPGAGGGLQGRPGHPCRSCVTGRHPPPPNRLPSQCLLRMREGGHAWLLGSLRGCSPTVQSVVRKDGSCHCCLVSVVSGSSEDSDQPFSPSVSLCLKYLPTEREGAGSRVLWSP